MGMITTNQVFNFIYNELIASHPDLLITSTRNYAKSKFPCVYITETERQTMSADLGLEKSNYRSVFEVEVMSDQHSGGASEAASLVKECETAFKKIGYTMTWNTVTENTKEIIIHRHIGRFKRIIGADDTI